jgi:hypothetical protein
MDVFCLAHGAIRVGYVRGKAVLALTANRHYRLEGVRAGASAASAAPRLRAGRSIRVRGASWYLVGSGRSRGLVEVGHGRVVQIGIADGRRAATRARAAKLLRTFG